MAKELTEADVMTGFNPAFGVSAEALTRQNGAAVDGADSEGTESDSETQPEATSTVAVDRDVTLDGRTFKAPRDLADAFTREINRRDGTRGAELQTLRERLAHLEGAATKAAIPEGPARLTVPDPELQIENPAEHQRQLLEYVRQEQDLRLGALTQQYQEAEAMKGREEARRSAWQTHVDGFYSKPENAVLRENRDIVDLVLKQNEASLAPLSVEDGFSELSRLAKDRLSRVTGQAPELKARTTPKPLVLEGSVSRGASPAPGGKDEGPRSLTQAIKERRQNAAAAFVKGQGEAINKLRDRQIRHA